MKMFWDVIGVYLQEKENLSKAFITDKKEHSLIKKIVLLLINFGVVLMIILGWSLFSLWVFYNLT